ncbi:MAG: ROK-family transcriptional regulator [Cellulomonas sp. 73-92]|uniref:ROK family transcriptional regulator n=1 Tax=Cellulomonas sp. 73-92 TaxID=1895740 RepID=UPI0009279178|nr:ROK family protein [Cellulomonas sp. 73-92]OJV82213.1 MAG: ROK-family transcriptional regulator [Cellulomonas sp. 73-92]
MTTDTAGRARTGGEQATVTTLRLRNRAAVLQHVILARQTTRADIARECGLSMASAANLVADLVAEGLVHETGTVASGGGRPIALIAPRPEGAYTIGADIGERGVAVELFDLSMTAVDQEFRGGRSEEDPRAIGDDLRAAVDALRARNRDTWPLLLGIGLAMPGIVETDDAGRQTLYAQSLGWPPVPIPELLPADVPVFADNGGKTQAKAEQWFGAARGVEHAVVALLGRGVGVGLVQEGRLQAGAHSSAGEWGHTKIERGGRLCRCGGRGCVEAYVGAAAMLGAWAERGGVFEGTGWRALGQLLDAAAAGEPAATAVVDDAIAALGHALANLVNLTNPERIVVGGWVGIRLMDALADRIDAAIRANSLQRPGSQYELCPSTFGGDTVAIGAAILPLEQLIREPRG